MHLKACQTKGTVTLAEFMPNFEPPKPQSVEKMQQTIRPVFAQIAARRNKRNGQGTENKTSP